MTPEDDAYWPVCPSHDEQHWCKDIAQFMADGSDADFLDANSRICVPIFPGAGLYAEVSVGELVDSVGFKVALVKQENHFTMDEILVDIGILGLDEGRYVLSTTLVSLSASMENVNCTYSTHGFAEEMAFKRVQPPELNHWCMAYFGYCYPCYIALASGTKKGKFSMDPADYGVPDAPQVQSGARQAGKSNVMSTLQARYGR